MQGRRSIGLTLAAVGGTAIIVGLVIACSGGGGRAADAGCDCSQLTDGRTDAASFDGGPPRVIVDPNQVCQGTGTFPDQAGTCSVLQTLPYSSVGTMGLAYGGLTACPNIDATGAGTAVTMTIEEVAPYTRSDPALVGTAYHGRSSSMGTDCGLLLDIGSYRVKPSLKAGDQVQIANRIVRGNTDNDVTATISIRDMQGRLLLALVTGGRPGRIEADILAGLTATIEKNLCADGDRTMLRVLLTDGGAGQCALDAMTQRCCTMWDASYAVRLHDAFTSPPGMMGLPSPWITFEIARGDFWSAP